MNVLTSYHVRPFISADAESLCAVQTFGAGESSVRELAARLGFADTAAFSRAFKRWTGRSPALARQLLGNR